MTDVKITQDNVMQLLLLGMHDCNVIHAFVWGDEYLTVSDVFNHQLNLKVMKMDPRIKAAIFVPAKDDVSYNYYTLIRH
jgi:hypothetical protein